MLQPLDVTVNKPVKDVLRRLWNTWLVEGEHTFTAGGRMRTPTLQDVVQWIVQVWQDLDPSIIKKGFVKCCIANAMDGTEDDALWNDNGDGETADDDDDDDDNDAYYLDDDVTQADIDEIAELLNSDDDFYGFE